jgi:hypothetical protein
MHGLSDQDTKEQNPQRPRGKYRALTARRLARKNILQLARLVRRIGRGRRVGCTQGDIAALLRRRRVGLAAVTA